MRMVIFMLALFSFPLFGMGQNVVTGKIIDELGLPIYLATIEINETNEVAYTDFDGNFSIANEKDFHWKITISSKGYKTESFFVLSGGSAGEIVLQYDEELKKLLERQ